jgi:hypothetical protein
MHPNQLKLEEEFNKLKVKHKANLSNADASRTENSYISENNPTEGGYKAEYQGYLNDFKGNGHGIISSLENEVSAQISLLKQVDNEKYGVEEKNKIDEKFKCLIEAKEIGLSNSISNIENNPNFLNSRSDFQQKNATFIQKQHETGRIKPIIKSTWYWIALSIIGIVELSIYFQAFSFTGGSNLGTLLIALSSCIVFPFCAHYFGNVLKMPNKNFKNYVAIFCIVIICVGLSYFLADMVVRMGITRNTIKSSSAANAQLFTRIALGLGMFLVGCLISYFNHEADISFLDSFNQKNETEKMFKNLQNGNSKQIDSNKLIFKKEIENLKHNKQVEIGNIPNKSDELKQKIIVLTNDLEGVKSTLPNKINQINDFYFEIVNNYRKRFVNSNPIFNKIDQLNF